MKIVKMIVGWWLVCLTFVLFVPFYLLGILAGMIATSFMAGVKESRRVLDTIDRWTMWPDN